ncbi:MAG TPA: TonB-dependent receptor [Allosphingosinicella sp.]|nr:TonB-dependent receptor [Allosphingosinicella sp.]
MTFARFPLFAGAAFAAAAPAFAQRSTENAVTSATDAFGTSVGNERVGIYNPFMARGFSPVQAGNVRLDGLYFDLQANPGDRMIAGTNVRVGISAQSYPFSAPTGIADYAIRRAGDDAVASLIANANTIGPRSVTIDAQVPVGGGLSIAGGAGLIVERTHFGADQNIVGAALIPRWRRGDAIEIIPFVNWYRIWGGEAQPIYFTSGAFLPPEIERGRYFGPDWARGDLTGLNAGMLGTVRTDGWTFRAGLFRSDLDLGRSFTEIALDTSPDGTADRFIAAERDRTNASWSGEVRASRAIAEGPRLHNVHFTVRGRDQNRRYGGGSSLALGRRPIDEPVPGVAEPDFALGPQTRDEVRQLSYGAGYDMRWRDVGELAFSVQRTDYRKEVETPTGALPVSANRTWLLNATASVHAADWLTFYAGYARGLEESPVAPQVAVNRDEAPPAIITRQMDAGARLILPRGMRLVAGLFDVAKPYFALDTARVFRNLGEVRHRGVELSLAGQPLPGLTAIVGAAFLDGTLTGDARDQGLIGRRPIGWFGRYVNGALDYRVPFVEGLSLDLAYESTSDRAADRLNRFVIPARYVVALGARYRFSIDEAPATLRVQAANLMGSYGWNNVGEGFHYNVPRRFSASLAVDL